MHAKGSQHTNAYQLHADLQCTRTVSVVQSLLVQRFGHSVEAELYGRFVWPNCTAELYGRIVELNGGLYGGPYSKNRKYTGELRTRKLSKAKEEKIW